MLQIGKAGCKTAIGASNNFLVPSIRGSGRSTARGAAAAAAVNSGARAGVHSGRPAAGPAAAAAKPARHPRRAAVAVRAMAKADVAKMTVAIGGGTGLIGSKLAAELAARGAKVRVLTRDAAAAARKLGGQRYEFYGPSDWAAAVAGADAVVNLAGTPIGTRWSPEIKASIRTSRIDTTAKLAAAISAAPEGQRPKVFLSSSAVGYYGTDPSATFTDADGAASAPGRDYLAQVCQEWEAAAAKVPGDVRVVVVRTGIVLAKEGGVVGKMLPIFELFAGGPLGSGQQWVSWVHRDDLVGLMINAIADDSYRGPYNGTAPAPVTMGQLCAALGGALGRPSWLPVPDFAVNALLGEGAAVVLEGQRVLPARAQAAGFEFKYPEIGGALRQVLGK